MLFSQLPTELVLCILDASAHWETSRQREAVIEIALVSREFYKLLQRHLYRSLIVTTSNVDFFTSEEYMQHLDKNVMRHVRILHIWTNIDEPVGRNDIFELAPLWKRWNPPLNVGAFLDAPWNYVEQFVAYTGFSGLRGLDVSYQTLANAADQLKANYRAIGPNITHLVGYAEAHHTQAWSVEWAYEIASAVPNLTHFGLKITTDESDHDSESDESAEDATFSDEYIDTLKAVIAVLFDRCSHLTSVVLRVAPIFGRVEGNGDSPLVKMLSDKRVVVWFVRNEELADNLSLDDICAGRDFWMVCEGREMWDMHGRITMEDGTLSLSR